MLEVWVADLARAGVDLDRHSLVLIQQVYGSGMITATLGVEMTTPERVTVTVTRRVPDGPLTPDLSIESFAVAIERSRAAEVEVVVDGQRRALRRLGDGTPEARCSIPGGGRGAPPGGAP